MTHDERVAVMEQLAADVATRVREADQAATEAVAAFAVGRFGEYIDKQAEALRKRLEAAGEHAIAAAGNQ